MTMTQDWAEAQRLVLKAASDLELARALLWARAEVVPLDSDHQLAKEMADFLSVVADGAWAVRVQVIRAREVLVMREAAEAALLCGSAVPTAARAR